jgi:anti-anti-sigma factor
VPDTERGGPAPWGAEYGGLAMRVRYDGPRSVVALTGELDAAHCADVARACMSQGHVDVIVDMADLTFMDCSGYGALVASRSVLRARGGSLSVLDARGEPLRLLMLVEEETAAGTALRRATTGYPTTGHSVNGHSVNGHSVNGHSVNGHSTARRASTGQSLNGHSTARRAAS